MRGFLRILVYDKKVIERAYVPNHNDLGPEGVVDTNLYKNGQVEATYRTGFNLSIFVFNQVWKIQL